MATLESLTIHRHDALARAESARAMMRCCRLCAFECGVDRTQGPAGFCRSDATARVFRQRMEWVGESDLVPNLVVNTSGCNMTCDFCITGTTSQNGAAGEPLDLAQVAQLIEEQLPRLRSFKIEGGEPIIHLASALEIAALVPREIQLVWKTNAYATPEALELLKGVVDVYLADYKFGNDACARRVAGIPNYVATVRANLEWARRHTRLVIRHLLMPGHLECCFVPVIDWMAEHARDIPLSFLTGYLPTFRADKHAELARTNRPAEVETARRMVAERGLQIYPWTWETPAGAGLRGMEDEIWIDRTGRINIPVASAELAACLQRLAPELSMGS